RGMPVRLLVSEAKFGTSQLGVLADGTVQMSGAWIEERLRAASEAYAKVAGALRHGQLVQGPPPPGAVEIPIPTSTEQSTSVWSAQGKVFGSLPDDVSQQAVAEKANRFGH